jgi:hypothetical protein
MTAMTSLKMTLLVLVLLLAGPALATVSGIARFDRDWRSANRESAGLAPLPSAVREAMVQVYGARAFGWRGAFAVHTWVAVKPRDAHEWRTHEVIGWRFWHGGSPLVTRTGPPDRRWFGAEPKLLAELRGAEAEAAIQAIESALPDYPFAADYHTWPGPNSNTFTAWIGRRVPALRLDLPPTAIGKDYLGATTLVSESPSGTGWQLSLFGVLGVLLAREEGLEINLLGLSAGIDPLDAAVKLPGLGRLGL